MDENNNPNELREYISRKHRMLGLFCVIQCWVSNLEGLYLERHQVEQLLGLERFKEARVEWLKDDLQEYFPHIIVGRDGSSFDSLLILRKSPLDLAPSSVRRCYDNDYRYDQRMSRFDIKNRCFETLRNKGYVSSLDWPLYSQSNEKETTTFGGFSLEEIFNNDEHMLEVLLSLVSKGMISPKSLLQLNK